MGTRRDASPRGTLDEYDTPLPWYWIWIRWPGCMAAIAEVTSDGVKTGFPLSRVITSPGSMPAACAGLPGKTSTTITPPCCVVATSIPSQARDPIVAAEVVLELPLSEAATA